MNDLIDILREKSASDSRLSSIIKRIEKGTADFQDTASYSETYSNMLGKILSQNIIGISDLEREKICTSLLEESYNEQNVLLKKVQTSIDEKAGLNIRSQEAKFPMERIQKLAHSLVDPTVPDETIQRRAESGAANISKSFHDRYMKENARFRNDAGLKCYIVRETDSKCCSWCTALAGRYVYGEHPDDIFRRHDNCGCTVTLEYGRTRQDVWTKRTWDAPDVKPEPYNPTVITPEKAKELQEKNLPKTLTNGTNGGIIKPITVDDFELRTYGKNIEKEVEQAMLSEIRNLEKGCGAVISDIRIEEIPSTPAGREAIKTEMLPNGLLCIHFNKSVFSGLSMEELDAIFSGSPAILANNFSEAMIHESGHVKYMIGRRPSEIENIHNALSKVHIEGVSTYAYSDGAECIAETEILLSRGQAVPDEAMKLYNKYVIRK